MTYNKQPYGRWSQSPQSLHAPKPPTMENTLETGHMQAERKTFLFSLKQNVRGRLLRITEQNSGRHNSIIVPATGLKEFSRVLAEMIQVSESMLPIKRGSEQEKEPS